MRATPSVLLFNRGDDPADTQTKFRDRSEWLQTYARNRIELYALAGCVELSPQQLLRERALLDEQSRLLSEFANRAPLTADEFREDLEVWAHLEDWGELGDTDAHWAVLYLLSLRATLEASLSSHDPE